MISGLFDVYNLEQLVHYESGWYICGKTGTERICQNWRKKSTAKDHSIFVAFAPMENQNSDTVENGGLVLLCWTYCQFNN
jgi:hypothetical protein